MPPKRKECRIPKAELEALLAAGLSYVEIAAEDGSTPHQGKYRARSFGLRSRCWGQKPRSSEAEFRALMADATLNITQIAEILCVSPQSVSQRARRLGLPTSLKARGRYRDRKIPLQELAAAIGAGMKSTEIARELGVTRQAVNQRRKTLEASHA